MQGDTVLVCRATSRPAAALVGAGVPAAALVGEGGAGDGSTRRARKGAVCGAGRKIFIVVEAVVGEGEVRKISLLGEMAGLCS